MAARDEPPDWHIGQVSRHSPPQAKGNRGGREQKTTTTTTSLTAGGVSHLQLEKWLFPRESGAERAHPGFTGEGAAVILCGAKVQTHNWPGHTAAEGRDSWF